MFQRHYEARCGTRSHPYPRVVRRCALRAAGVRLVVVTNKEARYTARVLQAHALETLFDRVISGDTLPVKKPNPLAVADSLLRYGWTAAARCWWATRRSMWPPRATPASPSGACRTATTWASPSRPARPTV